MIRRLLPFLLFSGACFAQITAGTGTGTQGTGASLTSSGITTVTGQLVAVACAAFNQNINAPTDSKAGNTWTQCGSTRTTAGTARVALFWSILVLGGAAHTFTCHPAASSDQGIAVQQFNGVVSSSPTDTAGAGTTGSSGAPSTGNITVAVANDVIVGALTNDDAPPTVTKAATYTETFNGVSTTASQPVELEYHIKTDAIAEAATWTLSPSGGWGAQACAFKPASATISPNGGLGGKSGLAGKAGTL